MCEPLNKADKARMIDDLANSIRKLNTRHENISSDMSKKYDDTIKRLLDKVNSLISEV